MALRKEIKDFLKRFEGTAYDPRELPQDGAVEKNDFVWRDKNISWVFFLRPKNPQTRPKGIRDGQPKFVKKTSTMKAFGSNSIIGYLQSFAKRFGLSVRKLKAKKREEMWQFS